MPAPAHSASAGLSLDGHGRLGDSLELPERRRLLIDRMEMTRVVYSTWCFAEKSPKRGEDRPSWHALQSTGFLTPSSDTISHTLE
jgi:hypothetical protein